MPGESQLPPSHGPDPSVASNDAIDRGDAAERDYVKGKLEVVHERLRGMDRATDLLSATVNRVPTDVQQAVGNLQSLTDEKFHSVQIQFEERDTRAEREARDNTIKVDAAFAAQKDSAARQDENNAKATEKSESATAKLIDAQGEKIDDIKDRFISLESRVVAIESGRLAIRETKSDVSSGQDRNVQVLGLIVAVLVLAFIGYAAFAPGP